MPTVNAVAFSIQHVADTKSSTTNSADVTVKDQDNVHVDRSGVTLLAIALLMTEQLVCHHFISSTPPDVIVFVRLNNNAFAALRLSTPLVDALPYQPTNHQRYSIQPLAVRDVQTSKPVHVDSFGMTTPAHVFRTQPLDAYPTSTCSTPTDVIVFVKDKRIVCVELKQ